MCPSHKNNALGHHITISVFVSYGTRLQSLSSSLKDRKSAQQKCQVYHLVPLSSPPHNLKPFWGARYLIVGIHNIDISGFDPPQKTQKSHEAKNSLVLLGPEFDSQTCVFRPVVGSKPLRQGGAWPAAQHANLKVVFLCSSCLVG